MIEILHDFRYNVDKEVIQELFNGVRKLSTFMKNLEKIAPRFVDDYSRDEPKTTNSFVGDAFEFFIELLIKLRGEGRIYLYDYVPVSVSQDIGIDGFGKRKDGKNPESRCAIQIKYRSNTSEELGSEDGLDKFGRACFIDIKKLNITPALYKAIIFTTAKDVKYYVKDSSFGGILEVFNYSTIRNLVDGVEDFWLNVENVIKEF